MFKKIKDDKLQKLQEQDISNVLEKFKSSSLENPIDEDEIIDILIIKK